MSRLLIVSNRAPVEIVQGPKGARMSRTVGGLAGALDDALRARGGTWIAWVGQGGGDELSPEVTGLSYLIRAVRLKEREVTNYYSYVQAFNFSQLGYSSAITVILVSLTVVVSVFIVRAVGWGTSGE